MRMTINSTGFATLAAAAFFALCAATSGCSAGGGGTVKDASIDFSIDYVFGDLPPGCPPGAGNDKGVGATCTMGGHQCPSSQICTCDMTLGVTPPQGTPCFCTIPIFSSDSTKQPCDTIAPGFCGQNATCCAYMSVAAICVPTVCLEGSTCPVF